MERSARAKSDPPTPQSVSRAKFDKRRSRLISTAATCFNERGYHGTSMRDIAREMNILPGTIYYYFPSKESLLVAVHQEGVRQICQKIEAALAKSPPDAWERLKDAAAAYLGSMLGTDRDLCSVIIAEFPRRQSKALRGQLLANREEVEGIFRQLVADLPLRRDIDRSLWRLALMGQLAWTFTWYKKGRLTAEAIARKLIDQMHQGAE